jgi:hypothetical protein
MLAPVLLLLLLWLALGMLAPLLLLLLLLWLALGMLAPLLLLLLPELQEAQ